jgi:hypothetical protein
MPYTAYPDCGLKVDSSAAYSGVDSCTRCGVSLPRRPRGDRNGMHLRYAAEALEQLTRRARRVEGTHERRREC